MKFLALLFFCSAVLVFAQTEEEHVAKIKAFRQELENHYKDKSTSPLTPKERRKFKGHNYYPIDLSYRVKARFNRIDHPDTVIMATSAGTEKSFLSYAKLHFTIDQVPCILTAYKGLTAHKDTTNHPIFLFVPFTDETSGNESYGGGRYLDIEVPDKESVILDFNYAYNPYCAYTSGWFCPIPPKENNLQVKINAGLKKPSEH